MTDSAADLTPLPPFPKTRAPGKPFDPHPDYATYYAQHRAGDGLPMVSCPAGIDAYVLTGYENVRDMMRNPHTSAKGGTSEHSRAGHDFDQPISTGNVLRLDGGDHARMRKLLIPEFSVPRMRIMTSYIQRIVDEHVDALLAKGPGPVDFVDEFAVPIPALVIAEMLGVPPGDRADFERWGRMSTDTDNTIDEVIEQSKPMVDYMSAFCYRQLREPTEDSLIGRLIVASKNTVTIEELVEIGLILLIAGHDTTANMIALSTLSLLDNPEQLALLRADPSIADAAVEEMLRYHSPVQFGVLRQATEDITVDEVTVRSGEWIINALSAANRDPDVFGPDPDRLDVTRPRIGGKSQLAFGFGVHQCLGQNLARLELAEVFKRLYRRIPSLRLAVPLAEVPFKESSIVYGPATMPVTWDV
ncbi:MAG TPA: cytochrome P450 [Pseudonocardiaceae bacterium]|nr:cytochrome P450 [Pseudonocardiaceae bacterium]